MRKLLMIIGTVAVTVGGVLLSGPAQAAPIGLPDGGRIVIGKPNNVENVHYVWRGRNYCWYNKAWKGSGWYRCGYAWRRGYGWGGPHGWHGWNSHRGGRHMGRRGHHNMGRGCCW